MRRYVAHVLNNSVVVFSLVYMGTRLISGVYACTAVVILRRMCWAEDRGGTSPFLGIDVSTRTVPL